MDLQVEFRGEKIIIHSGYDMIDFQLGSVTCMISAGEWDELTPFLDVQKNLKKLEKYATDFLNMCFSDREKIAKINGYMLCDSELNLRHKNYTLNKYVNGRMIDGKVDLVVSDIYLIDSLFDLINLEMMYAVINDMPINKCKNCKKYFVAGNAAALFCDRLYTEDKTCKQFGGKKSFVDKLKNDEALLRYEKVYQATYYRLRKAQSKDEIDKLNKRLQELKIWRVKYKNGEIEEKAFIEFVNDNSWNTKE